MKPREVYAVCHFKHGWLVDTCGGGTYSFEEADAVTYNTPGEAQEAMTAGELGELGRDYEVVPITDPWRPVVDG